MPRAIVANRLHLRFTLAGGLVVLPNLFRDSLGVVPKVGALGVGDREFFAVGFVAVAARLYLTNDASVGSVCSRNSVGAPVGMATSG